MKELVSEEVQWREEGGTATVHRFNFQSVVLQALYVSILPLHRDVAYLQLQNALVSGESCV